MADDHQEIELFFVTLAALVSVGAIGQQGMDSNCSQVYAW